MGRCGYGNGLMGFNIGDHAAEVGFVGLDIVGEFLVVVAELASLVSFVSSNSLSGWGGYLNGNINSLSSRMLRSI